MLKNCISSRRRQYISSESQRYSKGHHYKHSSSVFLGMQHQCCGISSFCHCRLKSFLWDARMHDLLPLLACKRNAGSPWLCLVSITKQKSRCAAIRTQYPHIHKCTYMHVPSQHTHSMHTQTHTYVAHTHINTTHSVSFIILLFNKHKFSLPEDAQQRIDYVRHDFAFLQYVSLDKQW